MTDAARITITGEAPYCPPGTIVLNPRESFEGYTSPLWYLDSERARPLVSVAQDPVLRAAAEAFWNWANDDGVWSILDVGCEDGWMMRYWAERGYRVRGIAPRSEGLPNYGVVGDMHTFDLTHMAPFDAAWIFHSLGHALIPIVVLRNAYRHLRPGGRLWIALRLGEWDRTRCWLPNLTPERLKDSAVQAGFAMEREDVQVIGRRTEIWLECSR